VTLLPENIPEELKLLPQWVLWKQEWRHGNKTKLPCSADGKGMASVNDPSTWGSFEQVLTGYRTGWWAGVGFVFTQRDPYVGIDLDLARCGWTGELTPWCREIVDLFPTYTETSPNGEGLKLFLKGGLLRGEKGRRKLVGSSSSRPGKLPGIEVYQEGRFFAVTGDHLEGTPKTINAFGEDLHGWFRREFPARPEPVAHECANDRNLDSSERDRLVRRAGAYLSKLEPAISGQHGHDTTYRTACILRCDFGLTEDEAWPIFLEWNRKCLPPWGEYELRRKLREAAKQPVTLKLVGR
jgi:hypothetical protein